MRWRHVGSEFGFFDWRKFICVGAWGTRFAWEEALRKAGNGGGSSSLSLLGGILPTLCMHGVRSMPMGIGSGQAHFSFDLENVYLSTLEQDKLFDLIAL